MPTFEGSLFWVDFLGKKICDKLFALYRQKTPGTGGGGGSGPGMGEYLGGTYPVNKQKARGNCGFHPSGTSLLHSSAVIAPCHQAFPASLASSQGYLSNLQCGYNHRQEENYTPYDADSFPAVGCDGAGINFLFLFWIFGDLVHIHIQHGRKDIEESIDL